MASKEAKSEGKAKKAPKPVEEKKEKVVEEEKKEKETKKEEKEDAESFAFEFKIAKDKVGPKTTNKQLKATVQDAIIGWGQWNETKVGGETGADRVVTIFFSRLLGKGQPVWDAIGKGEKPTIKLYGEDLELTVSDAKPSGGGAATGTSYKPKKVEEKSKGGKRDGKRDDRRGGRERGEGKKEESGKGEGKDGEGKKEGGKDGKDGKDDDKKKKGKKEDPKGSLQRGRANIGGKLGPVSKVRQAKAEKKKRDEENAARIARGEAPLEEPKKEEEPEEKKEDKKGGKDAKGGKDGKKEAGKAGKDGGKKGDAKKDAGKAEGKKEAGKKAK